MSVPRKLLSTLLLTGTVLGFGAASRAAVTAPVPPIPATAPTAGEIKALDAFLDTHSVIDDELRKHPDLADNAQFIQNHPEYAAFLADHPGVSAQLADHPRYFVHRALERQRREPITPEDVKRLDAFLDNHPDIEKDLRANPELVDDPKFVEDHPEFHAFLNDHPGVDDVLLSKPVRTVDASEHPAVYHEIGVLDDFLSAHVQIDDELMKHPALADSAEFIQNHPEYAVFLADHPGVAGQLAAHPRYFLHRVLVVQSLGTITADQVKALDDLLDQHPDIDKALAADPQLITDPKFIAAHPELRAFLDAHPDIAKTILSKAEEKKAEERERERERHVHHKSPKKL